MTIIDPFDVLEGGPDLEVIATNLTAEAKRKKRLTKVDLTKAITSCKIADTMRGSSSLTIVFTDPDFELMDSNFFDCDTNGRLDPIDLEYGKTSSGDPQWWRITQANPKARGVIETVWMERAAVFMMDHKGPLKDSRAKSTRAQFIGKLVGKVKAGGGIDFVSHDLKKTQPIQGPTKKDIKKQQKERDRTVTKSPGIDSSEDLKIQGVKANPTQIALAERILDVATKLDAPELAVEALMCAAIGETGISENTGGGTGNAYIGVFQGQRKYFKPTDTEEEAHYFLVGGKGYGGGGAIHQANTQPDKHPGLIAADTEVSYPNAQLPNAAAAQHYYGKYLDEAKAIISAYGGGSFGSTTYTKQYNFTVGTTQDPHEDYWTAANRLADEVKWAFFMDGNVVYYDPETTLIKQKIACIIDRDDPAVLDWDVTWDTRKIATNVTLSLICDPFRFRAGQVLKLSRFGPATTGSTAKLPGRWLIETIDRDRSDVFSQFSLIQPHNPSKEPQSEQAQRADKAANDTSTISGSMTPKDIIDQFVLPIARDDGIHVTPASVEAANARHTHLGSASDHAGPPAVKWAADMSDGMLTPNERQLVKDLCHRFNIPYSFPILASVSDDHFRYQIIHGANFPQPTGEHRDHVHFGVKRIK